MMMICYNVPRESDDKDDPRFVNIPKSNGSSNIVAPKFLGDEFKQPPKLKKVNIGTT